MEIRLINEDGDEYHGELRNWPVVPRIGEVLHYDGQELRVLEVRYVVNNTSAPLGEGDNHVVLSTERV